MSFGGRDDLRVSNAACLIDVVRELSNFDRDRDEVAGVGVAPAFGIGCDDPRRDIASELARTKFGSAFGVDGGR